MDDFVESRGIPVRQAVKPLAKDRSHFRFSVFEHPQGSVRGFSQIQILTENTLLGLTVEAGRLSTIVSVTHKWPSLGHRSNADLSRSQNALVRPTTQR